jgi:MarR family transcriptional regulator, multiple antibiotic resistance protein MarR
VETMETVEAIYDVKTFDPASGIGRLFSRVRMQLFEALDAEFAPFDITAAQYIILVNLAHGEADSASGLCKGVSYDPGAMTRMIDRLEKKGLVQRVPCPNDRRRAKLQLTAEGKAVYPTLVERHANVLNRKLSGFSRPEIKQLEGFLERVLANE